MLFQHCAQVVSYFDINLLLISRFRIAEIKSNVNIGRRTIITMLADGKDRYQTAGGSKPSPCWTRRGRKIGVGC